jgi:hypothetical protein
MTKPKHSNKIDARGVIPESWNCIDCSINTAPGCSTRAEFEIALQASVLTASGKQGVTQTYDERSEVYTVKPEVWRAAGMDDLGGCLCIGCLEKRLGRFLTPKDFPRNHPFHSLPGTERLLSRRDGD